VGQKNKAASNFFLVMPKFYVSVLHFSVIAFDLSSLLNRFASNRLAFLL